MEEVMALYDAGHDGWLGDLAVALRSLPVRVTLLPTATLRLPGAVDAVIAAVDKAMRTQLLADVKNSPQLYLMKDRLEPQKRGPPKKTLTQFRHNLRLRDKEDRKAFARLLASECPFALEKLRHSHTRNRKLYKKVDRDRRLCRFCALEVDSPEHALLTCTGHEDLVEQRQVFVDRLRVPLPSFVAPLNAGDARRALQLLLATPNVASEMASFTRKVFGIFSTVELVWPPEFVSNVAPRAAQPSV